MPSVEEHEPVSRDASRGEKAPQRPRAPPRGSVQEPPAHLRRSHALELRERDDDGVGVTRDDERTHRATSSRTNDDAHASVVPSQPPPTRKAVDVAPASVDDEDDWLDDLLNDG